MKLISKFFMVIFFSQIICKNITFSMEKNEKSERNWRTSLDLYSSKEISEKIFESDNWFEETIEIINENEESSIRAKFSRSQKWQSNIAAVKFTLLCKIDGREKFIIFSKNIKKIFISGLSSFNEKNDDIIFPIDFVTEEQRNKRQGQEINRVQREKVEQIIGKKFSEFTKSKHGSHSEESIVIYIDHHIIDDIIKNDIIPYSEGKNVEIIGTILQISSLKDPCSNVCFPMLENFMSNMNNILKKHIEIGDYKTIKTSNNLNNIFLFSGVMEHIEDKFGSTRDNMKVSNEKITVDYENPKNMIFSMDSNRLIKESLEFEDNNKK
jgi:hypothetical protein